MSFASRAIATTLKVQCMNCAYRLSMADLIAARGQIKVGILVCPKCQAVIKSRFYGGISGINKTNVKPSERIRLKNDGVKLTFAVPWRSNALALIACSIVWLLALALGEANTTEPLGLFFGFLVAVGILVGSTGIVRLVNKTHVILTMRDLRFHSGPIRFSREKVITTDQILNFSVQQETSENGHGLFRYYRVDINFKNGTAMKLCSTLDIDESVFIETELEKFLKLEDRDDLDLDGS